MRKELSAIEKQQLDRVRAALGANLDSRAKFELLAFWARHPSGWSSRGALAPRSVLGRQALYEALGELVETGVVEKHEETGICFYGLARKHPAYASVLQVRTLTPKRRKYLMHVARADSMPPAPAKHPEKRGSD
jgi:hypothetical protein